MPSNTILPNLSGKKIFLASEAENKKQLVQQHLGLDIIKWKSNFAEDLKLEDFNNSFPDYVEETALQKLLDVEKQLKTQNTEYDLIIAADTMVGFEKELRGKADSRQHAFDMLSSYRSNKTTVYTGVAIKTKEGKLVKFTDTTNVHFGPLTDTQINNYLDTDEYKGKAGAFAVQGFGATLIKRLDGSYPNCVGMPVQRVYEVLKDLQ